jgi:hypothetical protein
VITTAVSDVSAVSAATSHGTRLYDGTGGATEHTSARRDWRREWRGDPFTSTDSTHEKRCARRWWALRMPSTTLFRSTPAHEGRKGIGTPAVFVPQDTTSCANRANVEQTREFGPFDGPNHREASSTTRMGGRAWGIGHTENPESLLDLAPSVETESLNRLAADLSSGHSRKF